MKITNETSNRSLWISIIILLLFSFICSRLPLLNYLGFEFSVFTVLIAGLVSGLLTLSLWKQYDRKDETDIWCFLRGISSAQFVLFMIPFLISFGNAVFVKNCSIGNGAILYVLIVLPGMIFSISLAMFIGVLFGRWQKVIYIMLYILILLHIPIVTLFRPQIFAFNPIIGFFPGITYDETLQVTQRLIIYRISTLAISGFIFASSVWIWQIRIGGTKYRGKSQKSLPILETTLLALLGPPVLVIFFLSNRLGLSSSEEYVKWKLAGSYKTEHFEIIYPAGTVKREQIEKLGDLHEFYFDKLVKELKLGGQELITSFIYATPGQKGRLTGAANTDIAKPWLRQIHINLDDIEFSLKHELAHVLAAEFGWSPLKIASSSGLIEGLAVAMEETAIEEPLNRAAAMTLSAGTNPDLESLFTTIGFIKMNARTSYTLAGAFCRSLIDSFGIEKFKSLYKTGDFTSVYQKDMKLLLSDWQNSIRNIPLSAADSTRAEYIFRRPSIFSKECARVIANLNAGTRELLDRREFEEALNSAEKTLGLSISPEAVHYKLTALFRLRKFDEVVKFVEQQHLDPTFGYTYFLIRIRLGDAYWAMDSIARAKNEYETLENIHFAVRYDEEIRLRLECFKNITDHNEIRKYFIYLADDTARIRQLERLQNPVARYLLAREYVASERFAEGARTFESIGEMQSKILEYFRLKRLGIALFKSQKYKNAKVIFEKLSPITYSDYLRIEAKEWIEKCEFMQNRNR